ncbi:MAG UNVERIFIED_CONTAM: hypothetical protein LVR18_38785 [Planctomycetaceae bacterium]
MRLKFAKTAAQSQSGAEIKAELLSHEAGGDPRALQSLLIVAAAIESKHANQEFCWGQTGSQQRQLAFGAGLIERWNDECDANHAPGLREQGL